MRVRGVRAGSSTGVARYAGLLADALMVDGFAYECAEAPSRGWETHFHLANSSRAASWQAPRRRRFVVTVHDVVPRTASLEPLYRRVVYPLVVRRAARLIVHSTVAAELLARRAGVALSRIDVVPHPAPRAPELTREEARAELGWSPVERIAVLPGAIRSVKLVGEAVAAANQSGWRLALVGEPRERDLVEFARGYGALVCASPTDDVYQRAVIAADCVLVLRRDSVGETNGPLLDAIGAGRAVLATAVGAIPEVAGGAAELCEPETVSIGRGLVALADPDRRGELEALAAARAVELGWAASARAHRAIFEEAFAC